MKWSWSDYEAMIGLRKEKKKKKRQKKKPTSGALHATKALLHSMMLAKLLFNDASQTIRERQQKCATEEGHSCYAQQE